MDSPHLLQAHRLCDYPPKRAPPFGGFNDERLKEFGNNIIDVHFFPALTHDGKMILETPTSLASRPMGMVGYIRHWSNTGYWTI